MQDILDSTVEPIALGMISSDPRKIALEAIQAIKNSGTPTMIFIDPTGRVFAHPAAYALELPVADIIGTYTASVENTDLVDDLYAAALPLLRAIGIIAPARVQNASV